MPINFVCKINTTDFLLLHKFRDCFCNIKNQLFLLKQFIRFLILQKIRIQYIIHFPLPFSLLLL